MGLKVQTVSEEERKTLLERDCGEEFSEKPPCVFKEFPKGRGPGAGRGGGGSSGSAFVSFAVPIGGCSSEGRRGEPGRRRGRVEMPQNWPDACAGDRVRELSLCPPGSCLPVLHKPVVKGRRQRGRLLLESPETVITLNQRLVCNM